MEQQIHRGKIYYANLEPIVGSEQNGIRPVLIIQNDFGNKYSPTVIMAPITNKINTKSNIPTHVFIKAFGKLKYDSIILLEQIRVIDKQRLGDYVGKLTDKQMKKIEYAISISFGIGGIYEKKGLFSKSKKS